MEPTSDSLHLVLGRNVEESLNGSLKGKVNVVSLVLHALDACTMSVNLQKFSDCLYNLWPWANILSLLPVERSWHGLEVLERWKVVARQGTADSFSRCSCFGQTSP